MSEHQTDTHWRELDGSTYYKRSMLFCIAAVIKYPELFKMHTGSLYTFWNSLGRSDRDPLKQQVDEALRRIP